jgi:hypothetical protein
VAVTASLNSDREIHLCVNKHHWWYIIRKFLTKVGSLKNSDRLCWGCRKRRRHEIKRGGTNLSSSAGQRPTEIEKANGNTLTALSNSWRYCQPTVITNRFTGFPYRTSWGSQIPFANWMSALGISSASKQTNAVFSSRRTVKGPLICWDI